MHPRLDHFIVRPDMDDGTPGPIVPLIAVDQLPGWIQLTGVPRDLDAEQTIGLINLGIVHKQDDSVFEVRLHHDKTGSDSQGSGKGEAKNTETKKTISPTEIKRKCVQKAASENTLVSFSDSSTAIEPSPPEQQQPRMLSASRHNTNNTTVGTRVHKSSEKPVRPHMTEATRDGAGPAGPKHTLTTTTTTKKQDKPPTTSCRNWCHHGICKWGDDCRYQHCMPATVEGLWEVGLKEFPTWYLLKMSDGGDMANGAGLPGLVRMNAMLSSLGDAQSPAQQQQPPPPPQPLIQLHDQDRPSQDLHQRGGRMTAPIAGGVTSPWKKQKQNKVRHITLRGARAAGPQAQTQVQQQQQQQPRPHSNDGDYANVSTNASVVANAASIRRQAERQQQLRNDMPVATRDEAREGLNGNRRQGNGAGRAGVGEVAILDIF